MSTMATVGIIVVAVVILAIMGAGAFLVGRSRRQKQAAHFKQRWLEIQRMCSKSDMWPMVILEADKVLDDALKLNGYKGKTMGERLVAAQRQLSDNDGVWFGHKLRNKIAHEEINRLYKRDVQTALVGFRRALQDMGVL